MPLFRITTWRQRPCEATTVVLRMYCGKRLRKKKASCFRRCRMRILHRLKQEAFFLRKRFPQYILSTTVVASQGRCLQVVILNKGILSGSVSLFCLPQCLLISAYLALYPAGL